MAKVNNNILFKDGWNLPALRGFASTKTKKYLSVKNESGAPSTLFRPAHKAYVLSNVGGHNVFDENLDDVQAFDDKNIIASVGKVDSSSDNLWIAEYWQSPACLHIACFDTAKKEFLFAGVSLDAGISFQRYVLDFQDGRNGTVLWLAMIPYLTQASDEINKTLDFNAKTELNNAYVSLLSKNTANISAGVRANSYIFCDSCYWQVGRNIEVNIPSSGILPEVPDVTALKTYKPAHVIFGSFSCPSLSDNTKPKGATYQNLSTDNLYCKYALNENMSNEEKANVPKMDDWYVVPKWVDKAAHNIWFNHKKKLSSAVKQNNIFLFGEPGSGKTEGSKAIASALGLPFTHISMSANSDEFVFTGNIIPEVEGVSAKETSVLSIVEQYGGMDDFLDYMDMSPDTIYKELTGEYNENATVGDCITAYSNAFAKEKSKKSNHKSGVSYKFVESDFCKAIEQGWLVTIEEFTNVRDAGIAMVINQLMDGYQQITLPTGKVIKRHPNAVIVFASNVDEAQCGEFEASTLSRLKPMYKIETPSSNEMIKRVQKMTGNNDLQMLSTMADVVSALRDYIKDHSLVGCCGVREFAGWVLQYEANKDFDANSTLREAALETIVPSASPHEEDMEDVIRDIVDMMLPVK